ncbi:hypothetical protein REPUB_Repub13aG0255500 [Reevesia pubescens]
MQGMKDQASKCESNLRCLKDSASSSSSSSKQARRFSNTVDSGAFKAANNERLKQAEESLRTISSLNLLRVIAELEGCSIEELNAGRICDWFVKDKLKREQNIDSAVLQWDDFEPNVSFVS